MKKVLVVLVALMCTTAFGAVGDSWSISGDMAIVNGNPNGPWTYHNGIDGLGSPVLFAGSVDGSLYDGGGIPIVNTEVPDAGIGWYNPGGNWMMLMKFTVDYNPVAPLGTGDDKTNFVIGDVGGHAATGAIWTAAEAGVYQIDYLGYNARNPDTAQTHEIGRQTELRLDHNGVILDSKIIANAFESVPGSGDFDIVGYVGSAGAYTGSVVVNVLAGDTINLQHIGNDWSGLDMVITQIPEPATMLLLGLGSLLAIRRKK